MGERLSLEEARWLWQPFLWGSGGGCGWQGQDSPQRTLALVFHSEALAVSWGEWWLGLPGGQAGGMERKGGLELVSEVEMIGHTPGWLQSGKGVGGSKAYSSFLTCRHCLPSATQHSYPCRAQKPI